MRPNVESCAGRRVANRSNENNFHSFGTRWKKEKVNDGLHAYSERRRVRVRRHLRQMGDGFGVVSSSPDALLRCGALAWAIGDDDSLCSAAEQCARVGQAMDIMAESLNQRIQTFKE